MITQSLTYTITGGVAPYSYTFVADSSCVSFSNTSGTTNGVVTTQVQYDDQVCVDAVTMHLEIVDGEGCPFSYSVSPVNPCGELSLGSIVQIDDYKFQVTASDPGCSSVSFGWDYNTILFTDASVNTTGFTSTIEFSPNPSVANFPATSAVTAYVTDCNGCTSNTSLTFNICSPTLSNLVLTLAPVNTQDGSYVFTTTTIFIPDSSTCSSEIDWSTLDFSMPSTKWVATELTANHRYWSFQAPSITTPGTYQGTYTVEDEYGIPSNVGLITFLVLPGPDVTTITIPNQTFQVDCTLYDAEDVYNINIEDLIVVSYGTEIDWSTWQLVTPPDYASSSITLTTNVDGDHIIEYTLTDPIDSDVFAWTVCDTYGNCAEATFYTIASCSTPPTAEDDTACSVCGSSVTVDVLDNDTGGPFLLTSIQIVDPPSNGVAVPQTDGSIIYTPNTGFEGDDSFTYTVNNVFSLTSNEATVDVEVICAGGDGSVNLCNV